MESLAIHLIVHLGAGDVDEAQKIAFLTPVKEQPGSGCASFPLSVQWSSSCAGTAGTSSFDSPWETEVMGPVSNACGFLIELGGSGTDSVSLTYWAY